VLYAPKGCQTIEFRQIGIADGASCGKKHNNYSATSGMLSQQVELAVEIDPFQPTYRRGVDFVGRCGMRKKDFTADREKQR